MINQENGELEIANLRVSPTITLDEFLTSSPGMTSKVLVQNGDYLTLQVDLDSPFGLLLSFEGERLSTARISLRSSDSTWSSWSKREEEEKQLEHKKLLYQDLSQIPGRFSWGEVDSIFDSKSGSSSILVTYRKQI